MRRRVDDLRDKPTVESLVLGVAPGSRRVFRTHPRTLGQVAQLCLLLLLLVGPQQLFLFPLCLLFGFPLLSSSCLALGLGFLRRGRGRCRSRDRCRCGCRFLGFLSLTFVLVAARIILLARVFRVVGGLSRSGGFEVESLDERFQILEQAGLDSESASVGPVARRGRLRVGCLQCLRSCSHRLRRRRPLRVRCRSRLPREVRGRRRLRPRRGSPAGAPRLLATWVRTLR